MILETERLVLRRLTLDDADFIYGLVNEPPFLEHIGDKGVRDLDGAREYLENGPLYSYRVHGFGLYMVLLKGDSPQDPEVPLGTCGLLQRDELEHPDVGFAFKTEHWGKGYATEAAAAVLRYGREQLGIGKIVALTSPTNAASAAVLEKIGLRFQGMVEFRGSMENRLFA